MKYQYGCFSNILSHYDSIKKLQNGEMVPPRFCTFQTSYVCNHHCFGCAYREKLNNRMMKREEHIRILRKLIDVGVKGFEFSGGGEPLTLPYLSELIEILIQNDCGFGTLTNGSLFSDRLLDLFAEKGTYVCFSLETPFPELYCSYKNVPFSEWERVLKNIGELVRRKKEKKTKLDIGIKFSVNRSFYGKTHYAEGIKLAEQLGVDNIQFKCLRHWEQELSEQEREKESMILSSLNASIPVLNHISPLQFVPQCFLSPLHIVIDWKGDVFICCYYYFREESHKLGNLLYLTFEEIWYSPNHWKKIREIDKRQCKQVDCKFFLHHLHVQEAFDNHRIEFL
mgnify:CR=1 FL=1